MGLIPAHIDPVADLELIHFRGLRDGFDRHPVAEGNQGMLHPAGIVLLANDALQLHLVLGLEAVAHPLGPQAQHRPVVNGKGPVAEDGQLHILHPQGEAVFRMDGGHLAPKQVALANESGGEQRLRMLVHFLRRADLFHPSLPENHNPGGHIQGFLLIVGDIEEGDAHFLLHPLQLRLHLLAQLQIQRAQRFVQKQHLGAQHRRPGNGDALPLAAAKLGRHALFIAGQPHQPQGFLHPLFLLRLFDSPYF